MSDIVQVVDAILENERKYGWQKAFELAWEKHGCLREGTTKEAARCWYTKGRVAQDIANETE